jgi:hypothetical protein
VSYVIDRAVSRGAYYVAGEGYRRTELTWEQFDSLLAGESIVVDGQTIDPSDPFNPVLPYEDYPIDSSDPLQRLTERGGPGSGHRGHKGRPGQVGGSQPSVGSAAGEAEADAGFERHGTTKEVYQELLDRARAMNNEGRFAHVGRDIKTGEYLLFTERESAVEHQGNNIRHIGYEQFYAFTPIEMMFHKSGDQSNVTFDGDEMSDLKAFGTMSEEDYDDHMIVIHNHPERVGEFMPPSPSDLRASALMYAAESRVYTGDGTYTLRLGQLGNRAASQIMKAFWIFDETNFSDRFPELTGHGGEAQEDYVIANSLGDELKEYQLERLAYVAERLPWVSIEFEPIDE